MTDFWDSHPPDGDFPPLFPAPNTGGWQPGMTIAGTLTQQRAHTFEGDDKPTAILHLQDAAGQEWSVGCGANRLRAIMFEQRPRLGQLVTITCTGRQGKMLAFEVVIDGGAAPAQPVAAPAPAPAPAYAPAPAAPAAPTPAYPPQAPAPAPAAPAAPAYVPPAAPAPAAAPAQPPAPAPGY